jgi:hypothetical protein
MFDYNSLFNFAIYYGWLLVVALTAAVWIDNRVSLWHARTAHSAAQSWSARMRIVGLIALTLAVVAAFTHERRRFRAAADQDQQRLFAESVDRALSLDPVQPKFLNFDWQSNAQATRLAVYFERRGIRWWVRENWPLQFGADRILTPGRSDQPVPTLSSSFWRTALHSNSSATEGDPRAIVLPLTFEVDLVVHPGR